MTRSARSLAVLVALSFVSACGDDDAPPPTDAGGLPDSAMTPDTGVAEDAGVGVDGGGGVCNGPPGLYVPGSCEILAANVRPYDVSFALWADDAGKGRWVYLPPGTTIDTTDPNDWIFPMGTRFYKEFGLGAVRLETRMLEKTDTSPGLSSWNVTTYVWDAAQTTATELTTGADNVLGTAHDVPSRTRCGTCHRGSLDTILGFGAVQLAHDGAGVTLATLNAESRLTTPIDPSTAQVPGDAVERAALGYMHGNCGGCHRGSTAPGELRMHIEVGLAAASDATVYAGFGRMQSYRGAPATVTAQITPGDSAASLIVWRMSQRMETQQMPPIATELVDPTGLAAVTAWIDAQPPL